MEGSDDERFQYGDEFDDEKGLFGDDLEEGEAEMDEDIEEQEDQEDPENDVFALARETKEMSFAHKSTDAISLIIKICTLNWENLEDRTYKE